MTLKNSFILFCFLLGLVFIKFTAPTLSKIFTSNKNYYEFSDFKSITISNQSEGLSIEKHTNNQWLLNKLPVSKTSLSMLESSLVHIAESEIMTNQTDTHALFNLKNSSHNVSIGFKDGDLISFNIGKKGPFAGSQYFKYADDNTVYLAKDYLSYIFSLNKTYWYDYTILNLKNKKLRIFEFEVPNSTFSYVLEDGEWFLLVNESKAPVEIDTVNSFFSSFSPLVADKIFHISELSPDILLKAKFRFKITTFNNQTYELMFFLDKDQSFYVINASNPKYVYWLKEVLFADGIN